MLNHLLKLLILTGLCSTKVRCEVGKQCDPDFYDKNLQPAISALEHLYSVYEIQDKVDEATNSFSKAAMAMEKNLAALVEVPPNTPDEEYYIKQGKQSLVSNKGCSGLNAAYLTCDPVRKVCVCKNEFPFNNTESGGKCTARYGSVCAVYKGFLLQCEGFLACEKAGLPKGVNKARFCGGVDAYRHVRGGSPIVAANLLYLIPLLFCTLFPSFV